MQLQKSTTTHIQYAHTNIEVIIYNMHKTIPYILKQTFTDQYPFLPLPILLRLDTTITLTDSSYINDSSANCYDVILKIPEV